MCGIAGYVAFERDVRVEVGNIEAMTATMMLRGPDAGGVWLDRHVALGHRRLAVIDLVGGVQPMLAHEGGATIAALSFSGEVYNFADLRAELIGHGHIFGTRSDTEVVLRAYVQWGLSCVERFAGMFAFALWDGLREELVLARDRMGIKPLYLCATDDGLLFGSEPKAILAGPGAAPVVDLAGLRTIFSLVRAPGATVWQGITEVAPGTCVVVGRRGRRTHTYWTLAAREHELDLPATIRRTRELLGEIVAEQLVADVPIGTLLSGGLDSSAVTALAAEHVGAGSRKVRSFSVDFEGYAETFHPDTVRPDHDLPFVRDAVATIGSAHTEVLLDPAVLLEPRTREAVLRAFDVPQAQADMNTSLYLLFQAVRRQSTVALSGEAADEVLGGYAWFHDPAAVAADTFPWLASTGRFKRFSVLNPELERSLDLDQHGVELYRDALAEVPRLAGEVGTQRRMREITYLHLTRYVPGLLDRKDRLSMAVGLEVRVPYCDHRLVEFLFNVPWEMKTFDGREKSLLRAAVADLLPASVLARRKSHYPAIQDPGYSAVIRDEFHELLGRPGAPIFDLVDRRVLGWLGREGGGTSSELFTRRSREQVLGLDRWLTAYRPRLAL